MLASRPVLNNPAPMSEAAVAELLARGCAADRTWWTQP
jgi:hypothetical protein